MDLKVRVRRTIRRFALAATGTRVVAAISGGSDSTGLFHLLRELAADGELCLVGAAHFNHQLRDAAARDEQFCVSLAASAGVRLVSDRADIRAAARRERRSIEHAARTARHAFLERARRELGADVIALGHTRDDQAETFLLRLLRGAGARGLAAMHPRNGNLIRPLLECRREEVRQYLTAHERSWIDDESNQDVTIPRNRVRAELLPFLESRFNPSVVEALADAAEIARGEWEWLEQQAADWSARAVRRDGSRVVLDCSVLEDAPIALQRIVVRGALLQSGEGRPVSMETVDAVRELISGPGSSGTGRRGTIHVPGQVVERNGGQVVLTGRPRSQAGRPAVAARSLFQYSLSIPGEVELPEAGVVLTAETPAGALDAVPRSGGPVAAVRLDRCPATLTVRNRRPGDRFHPAGLGFGKKLQDFFVDKKIARAERDRIPIVVDGAGRIVWVAGHAVGEEFRVTDPAQAVLILRLKAVGGPV